MNRYQSIISAFISALCIFLVPWLNRKGIIIDETAVTSLVASAIAFVAFIWTAWKNHNITEAANEAQAILEELKSEDAEEELKDEDWGDEEDDIQTEE